MSFKELISKNKYFIIGIIISFLATALMILVMSFLMYFNAELLVDKMHYGFAFVVCVIFLTHDYKNG